MEKPVNTSWLWKAGDGVNGLKIDAERQRIEWYDSLGCACGDSTETQTYNEFRTSPAFGDVPDDVLTEINESLAALEA